LKFIFKRKELTELFLCIVYQYDSENIRYMSQKEVRMLQVTEKANEMIKEFLKEKEEVPNIRIYLSEGG